MLFKLRLFINFILFGAVVWLFFPAAAFAQAVSNPPAPIWPWKDNVPKPEGHRRVFLSADEHSVIILWPNPNGTGSKLLKMPLHNSISPNLKIHIESSPDGVLYNYDLQNGKQSVDSVTTFSIVVYPDPKMQVGAESWTGGKSTAMVGEQVAIPEAPAGGLALWFCPENRPLLPGTATEFSLRTEARPGFTTASTEHYPHLDISEEWPEQILNELNPVLAPAWIDQHIITIGPRYGPDEPVTRIASDYVIGINELIRTGRLEKNSAFVQEALSILRSLIDRSTSADRIFSSKPGSRFESEIFMALHLTLGIQLREQ
jgi:hypothetical protein